MGQANGTNPSQDISPPELPKEEPELTPSAAPKPASKRKIAIIVAVVVVALALIAGGWVLLAKKSDSDKSNSSTSKTTGSSSSSSDTSQSANTDDTATATAVTANDTCGLTTQVTQGPYYVTGTSQLTGGNLNYDNLTGQKIKVQGYVYSGATGTAPVAGAKIEIWHADDSGSYHPNSNGAASSYSKSQISLRGYVLTDSKGYYEYTTIYPGEYSGRTRHIHTNTTADGYKGVITQLIVPSLDGDQMTAAEDNIAQSLPECNQVKFTTVNGVPTTAFNYRISAN